MLWSKKKSPQTHERARLGGLELNASHARAMTIAGGHTRPILLDDPQATFPQFVNLEPRVPTAGHEALAVLRTLPHRICSNFLPQLGTHREWRGTRQTLTPETALGLIFDKMRSPLLNDAEYLALILPPYLTVGQVKSVLEIAAKSKLPIRGTASLPLAILAHRSEALLTPSKPQPAAKKDDASWVVPMRAANEGPGSVVILDVDEYALSITIAQVAPHEVRLLATGHWPRLSMKIWKDRLIDALSDRCVRLCRRDPRDSASTEQGLFSQLDEAMERMSTNQGVTLTVRSERWYQDLELLPNEWDSGCAALAKQACESLTEVLTTANLPVPPRALWLTDKAGKLPGLAAALYQQTSERTNLAMLPSSAACEAATALLVRWLGDQLPRTHLDGVIPLEMTEIVTAVPVPQPRLRTGN